MSMFITLSVLYRCEEMYELITTALAWRVVSFAELNLAVIDAHALLNGASDLSVDSALVSLVYSCTAMR